MEKIDEIINGFLNYLSSTQQKHLLPKIVERLNQIINEEKDIAYVTSAVSLTNVEQDKILKYLYKIYNKNFVLKIDINKNIIGGLKIIVGDKVIDQSINGRIDNLVEKLIS
ncbi:MAG: ATP synthase F1 subunit delta [Candidatus Gottesmanbacteria bacterium]